MGKYREGWFWYPEPDRDDQVGSLETVLAGRDPSEYERMVTQWRLSDLLIYMEQRRVFSEWKDIDS